ncbi:MAG: NRDE family protein [bacterium]|nr:NRDE family protein [bacterium]
MCTIVLRLDPEAAEPVRLAANRDEFRDRAADDPMPVAPGIFAGRDRRAGGTWLAVGNGRLAALTNVAEAPRDAGARSRGELPLLALAGRLPDRLDAWNAFNLLIVDEDGARVVTHLGGGRVLGPVLLGPGAHAIVNEPFGHEATPRGARVRLLLDDDAPADFPLLCDHGTAGGTNGLCHHGRAYGTVSSTVLALGRERDVLRYWHRPGQPCTTPTVDLTAAARAATPR